MANFCVRYGNLVFVMANSKNVVFAMIKNRCVRYGCVRYDGTPSKMSHLNFSILSFSINVCPIKIDLSVNTVWQQCWMRLFLWFSNTVPKPILDLFVNRKGIWVERKSSLKKLDFCLLNQRKPTKSEEKTKKEKPQNKHPYGKKMVHHIHNISNHLSPKSWECNFFRWSSFK